MEAAERPQGDREAQAADGSAGGASSGGLVVAAGGKAIERPRLDWTGNFNLYLLAYSVGIGLPTQLFEYAGNVLRQRVFLNGNGEMFAAIVLFSFAAGSAVRRLGCKWSQAIGLVLMTGFMFLLTACAFLHEGSPLQWPLYMSAGLFCGLAMALLPTALGPATERTAQLMGAADPSVDVESMRGSLMANFATASAGVQLVITGSTTLSLFMMDMEDVEETKAYKILFPVLSGFVVLALALMYLVHDIPDLGTGPAKGCRQEVRSLLKLWKDPRIWLLGIGAMCTGLGTAWKISAFTQPLHLNIGAVANAVVNCVQCSVNMAAAHPLARLVERTGMLTWMVAGSSLFVSMPALYWVSPYVAPTLTEGWGIVVFYIQMGFGYVFYDVVVRTSVLEHFPGEQSSYGFASLNMFHFALQAMCFFLGNVFPVGQSALLLLVLGASIVPGYLLAEYLRKRWGVAQDGEEAPDDTEDDDDDSSDDA